jgi:NAD(P)H dehydrogenase (quinone)
MEQMAYAAAEGVREAGGEPSVKRVPELVPDEIARTAQFKLDQAAPIATVAELPQYDGIILGVPTRFGRMASQMSNFWDQAGSIWAQGQLTGKVGGVMSSTATQHGGQETTLFSGITNLLHFGMVIVGLPYSYQGQMTLDEIVGGSPYGATTIAGPQGQRQPSRSELDAARFQGRLVANTARKLAAA